MSLNISIANYNKKIQLYDIIYEQLFYEIIQQLPNYKHVYCDVSKTEKGTAIVIIAPNN